MVLSVKQEHFLRDIITAGAAQCNECEQSDFACQSWLKGILFPGRVEQHCPFSDTIISQAALICGTMH